MLKVSLRDYLQRLPLPGDALWPDGRFDVETFAHGTMSLQVFAPRGTDHQEPHSQDELYIVASGSSGFVHEGDRTEVKAGDALFVPAGDEHRFEDMSEDFVTWVVFYGPAGGEAEAPEPSVFAAIDA
ncbi:cupin domain-containing protein [Aurantimonas sp. VKM B-3413]|uniref:cupin domain-containing protein n=1 Tax=Aurantimonas sp. VKM B-3413 TaxID=2779401 RepID=UPI001E47785F|nr:cupin domain-containing protein [Aurantimonas sp. VKM B-3413]MCB8839302.1 cupin domain-containing protein [Aurantimonas sp. VKM B-3413]